MAEAPGQAQVVPDVSIIIPYHNCRALTEACLDSVVAHSSGVTWELVLVDDASTDLPDLARLPSSVIVQHIRNESRKSYSANNNQAAAVARGRLLCLLNNDTVVTPGWLEAMVRVMDRLSGIGVLGNCHLYPDSGKIQHAGMAFDDTDFPLHLNPGIDRTTPAATREREFQAVTFACVMIPADTYRALHGLDESYRNGFEDIDFCLRARAAGYRVVYTPSSVIYHYGQSTPGRTVTDDANWKLFVSRWGGKVTRDLNTLGAADRAYNEQVAKRTYGKKRGESGLHLAVDVNAANAFVWATVDLAAALQRRGVPVSLPICATPHASISDANKRLLRGMMTAHPRRSYHVKWTHYWPAHFKQVLCGDVNAEFFCTNYRYREEGRRLDLWMRHVQVNEYRKLPVSRFNLEALREVGIPDSACRVMPLGYSPEIDSLFPDAGSLPSKRGKDLNLLLVTNSHDLYRYGTDLAIKALGRAYGPDDPVVVHIKDYGTPAGVDLLQQWIAEQPRFPRVVWHRTFLSKEDLIRLYAGMDVQLAPFRGEGFAMKILDAAAVGVPTLMPAFGGPTEFASEGMYIPLPFDEVSVGACYDRDHYLLGEGAYWCQVQVDPMADALRGLLDQRAVLPEMGALALSRIRKAFSWDAAAATLMSALEGWSSQRLVEVGARRHPDRRPISVIIPTKDREDILEKTLVAYQRQTLPKDAFDLVIVNDHGNLDAVKAVAAKTADLNLRILDNQGPGGPAAARNLAMGEVDGEVVLITGDDIVPGEQFLAEHVEGHRRHPEMETAFVGLTLWHPDLPSTPFMDHITGEGGQQFKYDDMKHDHEVPFDRLYTSNCSLKRAFLIEEEILFSTRYRYAAFEDVEFGYRLHHRGMVLRHLATAIGYHHHEMKPVSFLERQRKVGRMLTLMAIQRPGFVPNEHWTFLRALEFFRSQPALRTAALLQEMDAEQFIQSMTRTYDHMLSLSVLLNATTGRPAVDQDAAAWKAWMTKGGVHVWEAVNQAILRQGMAEEWAMDSDDRKAACAWVQTVLMPNIASFKGADWNMPFARPEFSAFLFPQSKWAYRASKMLRSTPLLGPALLAFEQSAAGQYLRGWLARLLR